MLTVLKFNKAAFQDSSFCENYATLITGQDKTVKLYTKFGFSSYLPLLFGQVTLQKVLKVNFTQL